ncbi:MAG TPA: HAD family hydrolase, partial [Polyangiaceae bacterium]|nr:HAD family hydrolase [Polyangiaceae bacterium]
EASWCPASAAAEASRRPASAASEAPPPAARSAPGGALEATPPAPEARSSEGALGLATAPTARGPGAAKPEGSGASGAFRALEGGEGEAAGVSLGEAGAGGGDELWAAPGAAGPGGEAWGERADEPEALDADALLVGMATLGGFLAVALSLLGPMRAVNGARLVVASAGCLSLAARLVTRRRDPADAHPLLLLAPALASCAAAAAAFFTGSAQTNQAIHLAGVAVVTGGLLTALRARSASELEDERGWVASALALPGRRVVGGDADVVAAHELRPGELLRVGPGEIAPADLNVTAGSALVYPWLGATAVARRGEGAALVAGARVLEGAVQGVTTWTGGDRAWARALLDPARRADVHASVARLSRVIAAQGALAAGLLAALATFANGESWLGVGLSAIAAFGALGTTTVASVASLHVLRGVLSAARRGISYQGARAWDEAARASVAVFAARGTLLFGEPDVVEVEATGRASPAQVLAWAAGAEAGQAHPLAVAAVRGARHRNVTPDAVRSPHPLPGLGVMAVTSAGETLLVGSRALMLEQRVSVALAEARVAELEGLGRTVLLVAVGGRLAGLVALQDGLRSGARAAVQHLLDVEVEPVLLSGEARDTCETIARALDIDHVRPEVLPADRAGEVRRLAEGGARVAVIGRPAADGALLGAADVSVALQAAGSPSNEWSVAMASDDVRDAALAVAIAHRTLAEARLALALAVAPGVVGALTVAFGLLPAVFAPLSGLVGGAVTLLHARGVMAARREAPLTPWDAPLPAGPASDIGGASP